MRKPTQEEIDDCLDWCVESFDKNTNYPGMTYEQGVKDAILWMQGNSTTGPHED